MRSVGNITPLRAKSLPCSSQGLLPRSSLKENLLPPLFPFLWLKDLTPRAAEKIYSLCSVGEIISSCYYSLINNSPCSHTPAHSRLHEQPEAILAPRILLMLSAKQSTTNESHPLESSPSSLPVQGSSSTEGLRARGVEINQ